MHFFAACYKQFTNCNFLGPTGSPKFSTIVETREKFASSIMADRISINELVLKNDELIL